MNYLDDILGSLVAIDTIDKVANVIGGTAAHEVGHFFGAVHIAGDVEPFPIMSFEALGLPTAARFHPREFSSIDPTSLSNAERVIRSAGSVILGDVDFNNLVDTADAQRIITSWHMTDRLLQEGELNGDGIVDASDAGIMAQFWTLNRAALPAPVPEPRSGFCGWTMILIFALVRTQEAAR